MRPKTVPLPFSKELTFQDYAEILEEHELDYQDLGIYYQVGEIERVQGWILHLSSIWTQTYQLLKAIVPLLKQYTIPFKIVKDQKKVERMTIGGFGYNQLGKVICIYPSTDEECLKLAKELLYITKDFNGCEIPTDFHLGGILYTRYGSFKPRLVWGQNGNVDRYIQDATGQFVKDEYVVPFKLPSGVVWPFSELIEPKEKAPTTFLKDTYKVFKTIKNDAKGRVMKSLRMKGLMIQWIIIKEAKHGVFSDANGRDNRDRLRWQHTLQKDLKGKIPVPEVYDFFEEKGNAYLVMRHIRGKVLNNVVNDVYRVKPSIWYELDLIKKIRLVDLLLKVVDLIDRLHRCGYVHRDINGANFILANNDKLVAIDLELAFSLSEDKPDPPYTLGTPGFISPEQMKLDRPKPNQDIYSLGALMIMYFTNLIPNRFEHQDSRLINDINFFIKNKDLAFMIAACLSRDPERRPTITNIRSGLKDFRKVLADDNPGTMDNEISNEALVKCVIKSLAKPLMVGSNKIWHSIEFEDSQLVNPQEMVTYSPGFYTGVSGVMYVLAIAKLGGYSIEANQQVFNESLKYLKLHFLSNLSNVLPGLYHGAAGIAMALAKGIKAGLINHEYKSMVENTLTLPIRDLNIAHGAAGQGLAALNCLEMISEGSRTLILDRCVGLLLEQQQQDGSWLTHVPENEKPISYTGFSQGTAGIAYFLLMYYNHHPDRHVLEAVLKSLTWLKKRSKKSKNGLYWMVSTHSKRYDRWVNNGTAGIALTFIKAYQILGNSTYKKISEEALNPNPNHLVHPNFTWGNGLTGLAEIYLTASEVFENDKWKERADFIKNMLCHTTLGNEDSRYWILENNKLPTADIMVGNSGILHMLLRYTSPKPLPFLL